MRGPLINVDVPAVGKITTQDLVRFAFLAVVVVAAWNYSDRIPVVGPTVGKVKTFVRRAVGTGFAVAA
ncbi:hypothetical protein ES702_07362 [subsurface metagenome]